MRSSLHHKQFFVRLGAQGRIEILSQLARAVVIEAVVACCLYGIRFSTVFRRQKRLLLFGSLGGEGWREKEGGDERSRWDGRAVVRWCGGGRATKLL